MHLIRIFVAFSLCCSSFARAENTPSDFADCSSQLKSASRGFEELDPQVAVFTHDAAVIIQKDLEAKGLRSKEARGYAIIIAAMLGSAAATTYVTGTLPHEFQFLSQFLAQVSTLGVFVFGAPIWEPLSSGFRKMAFGVSNNESERPLTDQSYESLWRRTQQNYSLNAQMSRNVISQFIISVQPNFYQAHRAMTDGDANYAADQVAEAAFRQKTLYRDIPADEASIAAVVRSTFKKHVELTPEFRDRILVELSALDAEYEKPAAQLFYRKLLSAWLD